MRGTLLASLLAGVVGLCTSVGAFAADPSVLRVIAVQTEDVPAYVREVATLQSLYKKIGMPVTLRVWQATFAGPNTGAVIVSIEVPNLATIAKLRETMTGNADIAAEMKKISTMRKILSDRLYDGLAP